MNTRIDPFKTSEEIQKSYLQFMTNNFSLKNPQFSKKLRDEITKGQDLFKGPILQMTPNYKKGKTIRQLIEDKIVSSEFENFSNISNGSFSIDLELYSHQEKSIRKIKDNKNIVVATGTGSGKTESFLYPIINHLLEEKKNKTLTSGIRALIVYPMNALANDQMERLRKILSPESGITFGRYTGQTEQTYKDAIEQFKKENNNREPQKNELVSRDQIIENIPNILLTNFSMLEYLLMRPEESALFDLGHTWKFIVLDEAHTYSGALGSEIGFLMRRLKDRICQSESGKIRCIATSATIGNLSNPNVLSDITQTANALFGENFETDDIIMSDIVKISSILPTQEKTFAGTKELYDLLEKIQNKEVNIDSVFNDLTKIVPENLLEELIDNSREQSDFIYHILKYDKRIQEILYITESKPEDLYSILYNVFNDFDSDLSKEYLIKLINLATHAKDKQSNLPLMSMRYHFFVKSLNGLSVFWNHDGEPQIKLGKYNQVSLENKEITKAFDIHGCRRCGSSYLYGFLKDDKFTSQIEKSTLNAESDYPIVYLALDLDQDQDISEDEEHLPDEQYEDDDDEKTETNDSNNQNENICIRCGSFPVPSNHKCTNTSFLKSVTRINFKSQNKKRNKGLKTCKSCGGQTRQGYIIDSFTTPENMANFVLTQSLMSNIPFTVENIASIEKVEEPIRESKLKLSKPIKKIEILNQAKGKKRLLVFSDSRQDASFYSVFLQRRADKTLHRQILYKAIKDLSDNNKIKSFSLNTILEEMVKITKENALIDRAEKNETELDFQNKIRKNVSLWLYGEIITIEPRVSLEGVGLIKFKIHKEVKDRVIEVFEKNIDLFHGLDSQILFDIMENMLNYLRTKGVSSSIDENIDYFASYLSPRNRLYSLDKDSPNTKCSIASWIPKSIRDNGRSNYLSKIFQSQNIQLNKNEQKEVLELLWEILESKILREVNHKKIHKYNDCRQMTYTIDHNIWEVSLNENDEKTKWYQCNSCSNITSINVFDVCSTYRCKGKLEDIDLNDLVSDNYFGNIYKSEITKILSKEHTAQISAEAGAERQKEFTNDDESLNVLSCSTTFEMGVDVGQLHSVFLKNVPPSVSNYVQRAGRAARRLDATAFILTFCRNRSHDLYMFEDALKIVSGNVTPPVVKSDNLEIAKRHLHSVVISRFFKNNPNFFNGQKGDKKGEINLIFFKDETICNSLYEWLSTKPESLKIELSRIFPEDMYDLMGIENWEWVNNLIRKSDENSKYDWDGVLGKAHIDIMSEYDEYEIIKNENPAWSKSLEKDQKRIKEKQILSYLSSRKVLPSYGFPSDNIKLHIQTQTSEWSQDLRLERDLKMAISEYAPGCSIVANGKKIESYALRMVKGRNLTEFKYIVCKNCGRFTRSDSKLSRLPEKCECGEALSGGKIIKIPIYGFTTKQSKDGTDANEIKPEKTYVTRVFFAGYKGNKNPEIFYIEGSSNNLSNIKLEKKYDRQGMLVVLNEGKQGEKGKGFFLCKFCGYGVPMNKDFDPKHKTPSNHDCSGTPLPNIVLGHEFQSDILELKFSGIGIKGSEPLWHSLLSALISASSKVLGIEEKDIDGTVVNYSGDSKSLVIFDNVAGGAGYVGLINKSNNLKRIIEKAWEISDSCTGCSPDTACNLCLKTYRNQYAHDILKRGEVAEFLSKLHKSIYSEDNDGFSPLNTVDKNRWVERKINESNSIDIVLDKLNNYSDDKHNNWYKTINNSLSNGNKVNLYLKKELDIKEKTSLFGLNYLLNEYPNFNLYQVKNDNIVYNLLIKSNVSGYLIKSNNLDSKNPNIDIKTLNENDLNKYDSSFKENIIKEYNKNDIYKLTQNSILIKIPKGFEKSWSHWLKDYLPKNVELISISDNYIQTDYHFRSLTMFLDDILSNCSNDMFTVDIKTNPPRHESYNNNRDLQKHLFQELVKDFENKINITFSIGNNLDHQRVVKIKNKDKPVNFYLDKGFDIFTFDYHSSGFLTQNTYIVIEKLY